ncbi:MAG: glutamine amidotransferase [Desulfosarcina sp.]
MKPFLIVKVGGTYADVAARFGDFEDWFAARMDRSLGTIDTVSPFSGQSLPPASGYGGILVTGSHDMVTQKLPWSERTAGWLRQAVADRIPVLGVCYGHQLLAHAMGGVVGDNPGGKRCGTVAVRLNTQGRQDPLFRFMPETFVAQACHSQSVLRLPAGATPLAASDHDPHFAFSLGSRAWGIQFHPEIDAGLLRLYIRRLGDDLPARGSDVDRLLEEVQESPESETLLRRFQHLCA